MKNEEPALVLIDMQQGMRAAGEGRQEKGGFKWISFFPISAPTPIFP